MTATAASPTTKNRREENSPFEIMERASGVSLLIVRDASLRRGMVEAGLLHPAYSWDDDEAPAPAKREKIIRQSALPVADFLGMAQSRKDQIHDALDEFPELAGLIEAMETHRAGLFSLAEEKAATGHLPVELTPFFIREGQRILLDAHGEPQAAEITSAIVRASFASFLHVQYRFVDHNGQAFCNATGSLRFDLPSRGAFAVSSLPFRFLRDSDLPALLARGERFCHLVETASHVQNTGHMLVQGYFGPRPVLADGRCMVDLRAMQRCEPDQVDHHGEFDSADFFDVDEDDEENAKQATGRPSGADLALCSPFVHGFSLRIKQ